MTRPGMGRGLAAILPDAPAEESELRDLPLESIRRNPHQPRTRFGPDSIKTLAASLAAAGVVQPLIVRPLRNGRYELIAGGRRGKPVCRRCPRSSGTRASRSAFRPR